ncbi:MAG: DUF2062 domain-containing protein [Nitrospirota bacterium]|nr:DUF2062 domain-containing protein [Nitrospirota bacterium]
MTKKYKSGIRRWIRLNHLKLKRINDTPKNIARGVALGVFLGIFPTFGLGLLLALLFSWLFKMNKPAAVIGSLIMNPYTSLFFWAASYVLGAMILGMSWHEAMDAFKSLNGTMFGDGSIFRMDETVRATLQLLAKGVLVPYLLGNFILSVVGGAVSYYLTLETIIAYRHARQRRLEKKRLGHH